MQVAERHRLAATFDAAADLYDRARPGFPDAALDWILPPEARRVLDLGAGTGKLTRSLAARGLQVSAVDTSAGMLAVLARALPDVKVVQAPAEDTGLPAQSFDAVLSGSAFHWFDRPAADAEIARVLRPGGVVGLLWNRRDPTQQLASAVDEVLGPRRLTAPDDHRGTVLDRRWFGPTEVREVPHAQRVTPEGFADLIASRSYIIALPEAERADVLQRVRDTAARVGGGAAFDLRYLTLTIRAARR